MSLTRSDDRAEALAIALAEKTARVAQMERGLAAVIEHVRGLTDRAHVAERVAHITHDPAPNAARDLDGILRQLAGVLTPMPEQRSSE